MSTNRKSKFMIVRIWHVILEDSRYGREIRLKIWDLRITDVARRLALWAINMVHAIKRIRGRAYKYNWLIAARCWLVSRVDMLAPTDASTVHTSHWSHYVMFHSVLLHATEATLSWRCCEMFLFNFSYLCGWIIQHFLTKKKHFVFNLPCCCKMYDRTLLEVCCCRECNLFLK